jgi:hypothetical protein
MGTITWMVRDKKLVRNGKGRSSTIGSFALSWKEQFGFLVALEMLADALEPQPIL